MRFLLRPTAALATLLAVGPPSPGAESPPARFRFATQTLTVPGGFGVEQVAAPPLVNRPISIAFDPEGRLYVTDSSGLSDKAERQFAEKSHRVVRLTDRDGDGRFDGATVFADRMMLPQGALFHEGSLYVAAPPHIWKLTDTNDDGVADRRDIWWDGGTLTGCANDVHGPYLGPDGWFYWTKGAFAEQRHVLGSGRTFVTRAAHIFRARPDGSGFEPVMTGGMDNPVGVAFSATGERFLSGTFFQVGVAGQRDGLIHAIYGGVYGKENAATAGHPRTGDLLPIMTHMGAAAPCGSTSYRSRAFGPGYADNLFVCYFNLRKIARHELVAGGATFETRDTDFVTSDSPDFRPTDVLEDADGSLLVVDTGGWYQICCPTSQLAKPEILGGIYRIRRTGAPAPADPRGRMLPWARMTAAELAPALGDERPLVRDRAVEQAGRMGAAAVAALRDVMARSPLPLARRHAVWALARIDDPGARAAVREALADSDAAVTHAALQVTSLWRDAAAFEALASILIGENPMHARIAAEALGRTADPRAIEPLIAAARELDGSQVSASGSIAPAGARVLEHAIIHALIEIGRREELVAQLNPSDEPAVIRAVLVALDQIKDAALDAETVLAWLDSPTPMLKRTAGWIVGHHPEWGEPLAEFFREQLDALPDAPVESLELPRQLAGLAQAKAIQAMLADVAGDPAAALPARRTALQAMAGAALKEAPAGWLDPLAQVLGEGDLDLVRLVLATVRALPPPKAGHPALNAALARLGRDPARPAELRLEALAAAPGPAPVEPELFAFLRQHLAGEHPLLVRTAAATVLARAPLSPAQQAELARALVHVGALELPKLLPAFERNPTEALGLELIRALPDAPGLRGLRANALQALLAKFPPSVQRGGAALLTRLDADAARQQARVDALLAEVKDGDVRRGQALFNSEKIACTLCHVIGYHGGRLGPDLTQIGRIRSERELLEAIVFPSATFVRGFEPFAVTTKSGETHSGILRQDTADGVVLATGPDTDQRIARAHIADLQPGTVSPMPPGMDAVLTAGELADLVAFLKSRQ